MQKKVSWRTNATHFHISLRLSSQTKDYFLAASHAGIALQGLPRLKAKYVADVSSHFFVALEMCITLQSPLFHYYKWADQQQHTEIAQPYICQKKVNGADCDVHRSDNDIKLNNEFYGRKRQQRWGKGGFGEGGRLTTVYVTVV